MLIRIWNFCFSILVGYGFHTINKQTSIRATVILDKTLPNSVYHTFVRDCIDKSWTPMNTSFLNPITTDSNFSISLELTALLLQYSFYATIGFLAFDAFLNFIHIVLATKINHLESDIRNIISIVFLVTVSILMLLHGTLYFNLKSIYLGSEKANNVCKDHQTQVFSQLLESCCGSLDLSFHQVRSIPMWQNILNNPGILVASFCTFTDDNLGSDPILDNSDDGSYLDTENNLIRTDFSSIHSGNINGSSTGIADGPVVDEPCSRDNIVHHENDCKRKTYSSSHSESKIHRYRVTSFNWYKIKYIQFAVEFTSNQDRYLLTEMTRLLTSNKLQDYL